MSAGSLSNVGHGPAVALVLLTLLNVGLQLASAALLKFASLRVDPALAFLLPVMGAVLALNVGRFVIWNAIHKRYPVSFAYPLSALFFPAVVALAWAMGERVGAWQVAGASLVMAGSILILVSGQDAAGNADTPGSIQ